MFKEMLRRLCKMELICVLEDSAIHTDTYICMLYLKLYMNITMQIYDQTKPHYKALNDNHHIMWAA